MMVDMVDCLIMRSQTTQANTNHHKPKPRNRQKMAMYWDFWLLVGIKRNNVRMNAG